MNDSVLFLALATIFGAAMLLVGWALRAMSAEREDREWRRRENVIMASFDPQTRKALRERYQIDETDAAGA